MEAILAFPTPTTWKALMNVILQEVLQQLHRGSLADKPYQRICPLHLDPDLRTGVSTSKKVPRIITSGLDT